MNFYKMHALGNDFCVFGTPNDKSMPDKKFIQSLCNRHYGVGCDCSVFVGWSDEADYYMHVFNPDGFEAEMCGNALRCSAKYVCQNGYFKKRNFSVQTNSGIRQVSVNENDITTEIGKANLNETGYVNVAGINIPYISVSLGNPHCVIFVKELSDEEFVLFGKGLENHPRFPNGTNVEFARISDPDTIEMRVWERGIGETYSCTTGSCACVAAANHLGHGFAECKVKQRDGTVTVSTDDNGNMTVKGGCETVFKATLL